ncbi:DUF3302 domain-containing protein [Undibacterium sp. Ren11W]|uniref:DUF3302 domain-containing protein n=1 Tax=Undibacterium sp. Ren11W TaxID=3413045 RepID=UPI003BEFE2C8
MKNQRSKSPLTQHRRQLFSLALLAGLILPSSAWAMAGMEEKIADVMTWVVLLVMPVAALYLFWKLHVLPEVFAEKHQHPQKHAINILCLLSLMVGGLLWPLAWLWAFTKPVGYKLAYGTDKHDDYFLKPDGEHGSKPMDLAVLDDELLLLQEKLAGLNKKRALILEKQPLTSPLANKTEGNKNA